MNGDEFLDRHRWEQAEDERRRQEQAENDRRRREQAEDEILDRLALDQGGDEGLAPLNRPNRDRPAETSADRRAQMEAAARASAAAAATAAAAPVAGPADAAVAFWPDLRPRLRTEADLRSLFLECAICTESTGDQMVMNCGHMMCRGCQDICPVRSGLKYIEGTVPLPLVD